MDSCPGFLTCKGLIGRCRALTAFQGREMRIFLPSVAHWVSLLKHDANQVGNWGISSKVAGYYGSNYLHDGNANKGQKIAVFSPPNLDGGYFDVQMRWASSPNRAVNVPVDIRHADGITTKSVDETVDGGKFVSLGVYRFAMGVANRIVIRTDKANGYVVADPVRFIYVPH